MACTDETATRPTLSSIASTTASVSGSPSTSRTSAPRQPRVEVRPVLGRRDDDGAPGGRGREQRGRDRDARDERQVGGVDAEQRGDGGAGGVGVGLPVLEVGAAGPPRRDRRGERVRARAGRHALRGRVEVGEVAEVELGAGGRDRHPIAHASTSSGRPDSTERRIASLTATAAQRVVEVHHERLVALDRDREVAHLLQQIAEQAAVRGRPVQRVRLAVAVPAVHPDAVVAHVDLDRALGPDDQRVRVDRRRRVVAQRPAGVQLGDRAAVELARGEDRVLGLHAARSASPWTRRASTRA